MLLEFTCSNHKSIRNEAMFSALAGKDNTYEDRVYVTAGYRVLKSSVIYGANGSGKSNFIDAISFVKSLVTNSIAYQPGQGIRQLPHRLNGFDKESSYKIQFVTKGIRYAFGFSIRNMLVEEEYLYCFQNNRQIKIFEREGETFSVGSKFKGKLSICKDVLKPNRLLLSCAANFSSVQEVLDAYAFFNNELVVYYPGNQEEWMTHSLCQMKSDPEMKHAVVTFLAGLGTGIRDIQVSLDEKKLESFGMQAFLLDGFKANLVQGNADAVTAKAVYDDFETDLMKEESHGIQKLLTLSFLLMDAMMNGKALACDEMESSLHESLAHRLVKLFINTDTGKFPQFLYTTHNTGFLNPGLFRRDQIWFAEMTNRERSTDLYSLAKIKNVRVEENFGKEYISGKYGAVPMINLNFTDIVSNV